MQQVSLGKTPPINAGGGVVVVMAIANVTTTVTGVTRTILTTVNDVTTSSVTRRHDTIITQSKLGIATNSTRRHLAAAAGHTALFDSWLHRRQWLPAVAAGAALQLPLKLLTLGTDTDRRWRVRHVREIFRRTGNTFLHRRSVAVLALQFALFLLKHVNEGTHFDNTFGATTIFDAVLRRDAGNTDRWRWVRNLLRWRCP